MSPLSRFTAASGLTNFADGVAMVAWAWMASLLTRDPLLIALVAVTLQIPWFICALPAGILIDRSNRRLLILSMDLVRGAAFLIVAFAVWMALPLADAPQNGISNMTLYACLIIVAFVVGTAEVFRDNAAQTILPSLVSKDQLERANGRLWSVELTGNALLGPALGAMMLSAFLPLPFALNALAYLFAVVITARILGQFRPAQPATRNWRTELVEAYRFLIANPLLRLLAIVTGVWNLLFQMTLIALVLHVQENLNQSASAYGLILSVGAIGGILGGIAGERIVKWLGAALCAQLTLASTVFLFFVIGLAPGPVLLSLGLLLFHFSGMVWNTVAVSYRQRLIPDRLLGRVNSIYRLLAWGMMPIGLILSGLSVNIAETWLDRSFALIVPFMLSGFGGVLLTLFSWRALGRGFARAN